MNKYEVILLSLALSVVLAVATALAMLFTYLFPKNFFLLAGLSILTGLLLTPPLVWAIEWTGPAAEALRQTSQLPFKKRTEALTWRLKGKEEWNHFAVSEGKPEDFRKAKASQITIADL